MKMLLRYFDDIVPDSLRKDFVGNAQIVDATSSARWFFAESEQNQWDISDDFPQVASPWPMCWMEFQHPGTENLEGEIKRIPFPMASGTLLISYKIPDDVRSDFLANHGLLSLAAQDRHIGFGAEEFYAKTQAAIKRGFLPAWVQTMIIYFQAMGRIKHVFTAYMYLDAEGRIDKDTWFNVPNPQLRNGIDTNSFSKLMFPFLFTISLLHCKNVHLEDIPLPPKVQKKREGKGIPALVFKTLVVEPMRKQVHREAADDPTGERNHIKRALHIARGHFKDYRSGPGLFGKYQGLYWWDMHVRGKANAGVVIKDYQVKR